MMATFMVSAQSFRDAAQLDDAQQLLVMAKS
jgi:hypothetical protein